jgi:hypothetical protein
MVYCLGYQDDFYLKLQIVAIVVTFDSGNNKCLTATGAVTLYITKLVYGRF